MFRYRFVFRRRKRRAPASVRREYLAHKEAARKQVAVLLVELAPLYGVSPTRISIRAQRTRWGSASRSGSLTFNYRLVFLPDHLARYIVAHELSHLLEHNHSERFWAHVARYVPDHASLRQELRTWERRHPFGKEVEKCRP